MRRGIFIDRDGVINKNDGGYILGWDQFEFLPGVLDAFFELYQMDYDVFVVSNQSGIGQELATRAAVTKIFNGMCEAIDAGIAERAGVSSCYYAVKDYMFCPHVPDDGCACRKPKPGMIYSLAVNWDIDLRGSWMIGDQDSDMKAGWNAGIRRLIKIDRDAVVERGLLTRKALSKRPVLSTLLDAVQFIKDVDNKEERRVTKKS